jgi:hypothetical protein
MPYFYYAPLVLAGIIGFAITLVELLTLTYPRTCNLLLKESWKPYIYSLMYGAISFIFMLYVAFISNAEIIKFGEVEVSNIWIYSVIVGLTTKALLHVRICSVPFGSASIPLGTEMIVLLFEPWLLKEIELDEFNATRKHVDKSKNNSTDLDDVKQKITNNLPTGISKIDKTAFLLDLDEQQTVSESMELYLRNFGIKNFGRVFPRSN